MMPKEMKSEEVLRGLRRKRREEKWSQKKVAESKAMIKRMEAKAKSVLIKEEIEAKKDYL
jgi:hypothetical protein